MSADFDLSPLWAGSWIGEASTFSAVGDLVRAYPTWLDTGTGRIVEVMLVDGCTGDVRADPSADPCAWRHSWMFHVTDDGTVTVVGESDTPDRP
ncbi:MAG: hypothetical protein U0869_23665 [Chloroflexota bacterium]